MQSIPSGALFHSVANFFALGMGLGLARKAPGTFGTLLGIPILLVMPAKLLVFLIVLALLFAYGVWCCDECTKFLGVHDHGGIVWDEVVGYLITMIALPVTWQWIVAGFVVFRFFDIVKPWPISWVDRQVHGGMGIMLDDVLAGLMACASLHIVNLLL